MFRILITALLVSSVAVAQPRDPQRQTTGVRLVTTNVAGTARCYGLVEQIDEDGLTLTEIDDGRMLGARSVVPIDLLRKGDVLPKVWGMFAYRWSDIKKGDTVSLEVLKDDGDGKTYCLKISIRRRPGGKLPESQNPKSDHRYAKERIVNEIENGNDVSEEEIRKAFPEESYPRTGEYLPPGLHGPYREKLTDNRKRIAEEKEKKDKELKAKPVTDKK